MKVGVAGAHEPHQLAVLRGRHSAQHRTVHDGGAQRLKLEGEIAHGLGAQGAHLDEELAAQISRAKAARLGEEAAHARVLGDGDEDQIAGQRHRAGIGDHVETLRCGMD